MEAGKTSRGERGVAGRRVTLVVLFSFALVVGCDKDAGDAKNSAPAGASSGSGGAAQAKPAGDVGEALTAYEKVSTALLNDDWDTFARGIADGGRPKNPPDKLTPELMAKFKAEAQGAAAADLNKTKALLRELAGRQPDAAAARVETKDIRGTQATVVLVPIPGTQEIAKKHGFGPSRTTTDAEGNLVVYAVKHGDQWYWNPFGW